MMVWREDKDLMFFKELDNSSLGLLFNLLTRDPTDGKLRYTQSLIGSTPYKEHAHNYKKYWQDIAGELQTYGANTFATLFRGGKGVLYREILEDVLKEKQIDYPKNGSILTLEEQLLQFFLETSLENMSQEERRDFLETLDIKSDIKYFTTKNTLRILKLTLKRGSLPSYHFALMVASSVSKLIFNRSISLGTQMSLNRGLSLFLGPVGTAFMTSWTLLDLASPAFRVTIPACTIVSALRVIHLEKSRNA